MKDQTFSPTQLEYTLPIRSYSNATLTLQSATLYDTERYEALAEYTDANGELRQVAVNSGAATYLEDIPFDASTLTITLTDRENADSQTVYTFHVTRPRDTSKSHQIQHRHCARPRRAEPAEHQIQWLCRGALCCGRMRAAIRPQGPVPPPRSGSTAPICWRNPGLHPEPGQQYRLCPSALF